MRACHDKTRLYVRRALSGAGFTHCHALWEDAGGASGIGHLLSDQTLIARDTTLEVTGFASARFERLPDAETRFEIFAAIGESLPETAPKTAQAIITTLRPNIDIATACEELCMQHGIAARGWSGWAV